MGAPGAAYARLLARLERTRALGVDLGLGRVRAALAALGEPQRAFVSVQVAGTNGKGSTAAMAESILRAAGVRTGLFTSPHLCRFTERIRIDGREVDGDELAALDGGIEATEIPLTYFEVATVLALLEMRRAGVEVAVLETGLGGRLDAVTAAEPVAAAITSIALDHTELLGGTLAEIAREKAGVARRGAPLYLGALAPEADAEIARVASKVDARVRRLPDLPPAPAPALAGAHQAHNATLALALARSAAEALGRALPERAIADGLRTVRWPGRLEWLAPDLLVDGAHNLEAARALAATLPEHRPRALVVSIVRGKDAPRLLSALAPRFDRVFVTRSYSARALAPEELAAMLRGPAEVVAAPVEALARARAAVAPGGVVVVAGSLFLVGQLRAHVLGERCDPVPGGDPMP